MRRLLALGAALFLFAPAWAAEYHDNAKLADAVRSLGSGFHVEELARDPQGRPIWLVRGGSDDPTAPAVLVVAGVDGRHLVGTEMALAHLRDLAAAPGDLLENRTVFVIPRLNPGAADAYFGRPREEVAGTAGEADTDRDGLVGEDPRDDMNGDGLISLVRVEDPDGGYVPDGDGDFLRTAKTAEGEAGAWRILTEGADDDKDELWNEEADGGVNLAANFPFGYEWFARNTGDHQVSRPETRAVAELIASHPNIAVVLVYGFEDNLLNSPSDKDTSDPNIRRGRWGRDPVTAPNKNDLPLLQELGSRYRKALGVPEKAKHLGTGEYGVLYKDLGPGFDLTAKNASAGGLAGYAYYHRGRLALATPVWTPGLQMARVEQAAAADTAKSAEDEADGDEDSDGDKERADSAGGDGTTAPDGGADTAAEDDAKPKDERIARDQRFRDWLTETEPESWLGWTAIDHPDFPGQRAEVGGYAPLATINPPAPELDSLAAGHNRFFRELLVALPAVSVREAELKALGGGAYELTVTVENTGYLPDVLAQGVYSAHARDTRLELDLPSGGEVLGGALPGRLDRIAGSGGSQEIRQMLHLPSAGSSVTVRVVSEMGGSDTVTLKPGETRKGGAR